MPVKQKPMVGNWYMNLSGQLIKVWALGYDTGRINNVVIEFLNGKRRIIGVDEWWSMDLEIHLYRATRRYRNGEEQHS